MRIIIDQQKWETFNSYHYTFLDVKNNVIGSYRLETMNPTDWYLVGLYIQPEHRTNNYGNKLLAHAIAEFRKMSNEEKLFIQVYKNTFMYDWYLRKGFAYLKEVDELKDWLVLT